MSARSPDSRPNLVTIVLDCLRAKSVAVGGGHHIARTPVIDGFARRGTTFNRAVAPSNWTVPSHMSMMTGAYPNRHLLRTFHKGEPRLPTLASWLREQGYETALFSEQVHLVAGYGLESGYEEKFSSADRAKTTSEDRNAARELFAHSNLLYSDATRRMIEAVPPAVLPISAVSYPQERSYKTRVCNERMLEAFELWLRRRGRGRPFHAFINLVNAHEPYGPGDGWGSLGLSARWYARTPRYYLLSIPGLQKSVPWRAAEACYLAAIEEADRKVGRLLAALEATGELAHSYVMLTSDHGQSFGERGHVYHGNGAVDAVTRVPLVVTPPSGVTLPRTVDRWTSLCDTFGWWQAAATGRVPYDEEGVPFAGFTATARAAGAVYCEGSPASDSNRSLQRIGLERIWNHRLLAAYLPDEKLVLDINAGTVHRWSLPADVDSAEPELLDATEADRIQSRVFGPYLREEDPASFARTVEMDATVDERLHSWGYD